MDSNLDADAVFLAREGEPFQAKIVYHIGWGGAPPGGGTIEIHKSAIQDPEYAVIWPQNPSLPNSPVYVCESAEPYGPDCTGLMLNAGVQFDPSTGILTGAVHGNIASSRGPGIFSFNIAVRDKKTGEQPYRGNGYWWVRFVQFTVGGGTKTWMESTNGRGDYSKYIIAILNVRTGPEVSARCTFNDSRFGSRILMLDASNRYVEVLGDTGSVAGLYQIDPSKDVIGWAKGLPGIYGTATSLDRTSGLLTVTTPQGQVTAQCQKRSNERVF